ncbi:MAG TPA: GNAT family N-acetyltransferase [Planctomycetota bacterium]
MIPPPHLRPFEPGDRAAIEAMAREVVEEGRQFAYEDVAGVLGYWIGPGITTFVAVDGTQIVGTYALKPNQPGRGAHVANAGYMVARAARGRGLGRLLGEHSLATARALGYSAMQFNFVVATNTTAVALWERLGFGVVGRLPRAFRLPEGGFADALVMHREL